MGVELRQFHQRHQKALRRHAGTLEQLYSNLCPIDAAVVGEDGRCGTCGRQIRESKPDFVQPPDMSDEQAEAQRAFWQRRERLLQEREQAATKKKPAAEEPTGRDWSKTLDSSGNVRW
jgi:hypothetical protein